MINSIFEVETGQVCEMDQYIITCHVCGITFSPVVIHLIPTDLCQYYANSYKRLCLIRYISDNVCEHVNKHMWNGIFCGDIESLPVTMTATLDVVTEQQPSPEAIYNAWNNAVLKALERYKDSV